MWGQVILTHGRANNVRIIPTRVGTRCQHSVNSRQKEDHPHACGDKLLDKITAHDIAGSSPRVWGQAIAGIVKLVPKRIIPTRVGTSLLNIRTCRLTRDHPHACGDKYARYMFLPLQKGSSPRVWGQVPQLSKLTPSLGIIPTRVGTSFTIQRHCQ